MDDERQWPVLSEVLCFSVRDPNSAVQARTRDLDVDERSHFGPRYRGGSSGLEQRIRIFALQRYSRSYCKCGVPNEPPKPVKLSEEYIVTMLGSENQPTRRQVNTHWIAKSSGKVVEH
jgi:hypothetical protein